MKKLDVTNTFLSTGETASAGIPISIRIGSDANPLIENKPYTAYCVQEQSHTVSSVEFSTSVSLDIIIEPTIVLAKTATTVTLRTVFSSTANAQCLVVPTGTTVVDSASLISNGASTPATIAQSGEAYVVTFTGLTKATSYDAYCTQSAVTLPSPVMFDSVDFETMPFVSHVTSTKVTLTMSVTQTGDLSCMVTDNDPAPSSSDILSSGSKTHGVYENTMNPNANTLITFTISDLVEGTDYDAYCALDDLVSDKIDFYTSRVINSTIATEITGKSVKLVTTFDARLMYVVLFLMQVVIPHRRLKFLTAKMQLALQLLNFHQVQQCQRLEHHL